MLMWVCHHGKAHLQATDVGGGLQIWTVATNMLIKQLQAVDPPAWRLSEGLTTQLLIKCHTRSWTLDSFHQWCVLVNTVMNLWVP